MSPPDLRQTRRRCFHVNSSRLAAAGGFDQPTPSDWDGVLLEHLIHHELVSHIHYKGVKGPLGYWATPSGSEVDFVWWRGRDVIAIEVKHARELRREFRKGIDAFRSGTPATAFIVYRGERELDRTVFAFSPPRRFCAGCTQATSSVDASGAPAGARGEGRRRSGGRALALATA